MHYYKRNIGDYYKKAGRLTMLQHGAYTLLQDSCYDRERFPTLEEAIEWTWASTPDEVHAVEFVLNKFFTLENGVYIQNRIHEEIEKYQANSATNKRIAIEREAKRKKDSTNRAQSVNGASTDEHEPTPNQEPRTINQEPLTNNQEPLKTIEPPAQVKWGKKRFADELVNLGADRQHANDWMTSRKAFTETAFKSTIKHINKTGKTVFEIVELCAEKGWKGFDAKYMAGLDQSSLNGYSRNSQVDQSGFGDEPPFIEGQVVTSQAGFLTHE